MINFNLLVSFTLTGIYRNLNPFASTVKKKTPHDISNRPYDGENTPKDAVKYSVLQHWTSVSRGAAYQNVFPASSTHPQNNFTVKRSSQFTPRRLVRGGEV